MDAVGQRAGGILAHVDALVAARRGEWETQLRRSAGEALAARAALRDGENEVKLLKEENARLYQRLNQVASKTHELTRQYEARIHRQDEEIQALTAVTEAVRLHNGGAADRQVIVEELARTRAALASLRDRYRWLQDECISARPDRARLALEAAVRERDEEIAQLREAAASALQLNTIALKRSRSDDGSGPAVAHPHVNPRTRTAGRGGGGDDGRDGDDDNVTAQTAARLGELLDTCGAQAEAIRVLEAHNAELAQRLDESQEGIAGLERELQRVTDELQLAGRTVHAEGDLHHHSAGVDQQHEDRTADLERELKRIKELVVDLEAANDDDVARAAREKETFERRIAELEATVADQAARLAASSEDSSPHPPAGDDVVSRDLERALAAEAALTSLRNENTALQRELQTMRDATVAMREEQARRDDMAAELRQANDNLRATVTTKLQEQATRHRDEMESFKRTMSEQHALATDKEAARHRDEIESLKQTMAAARAATEEQLKAEQAEATTLRSQCVQWEAEVESLRVSFAAARERLEHLQAEHAEVAAEREKYAQHLAREGLLDGPSGDADAASAFGGLAMSTPAVHINSRRIGHPATAESDVDAMSPGDDEYLKFPGDGDSFQTRVGSRDMAPTPASGGRGAVAGAASAPTVVPLSPLSLTPADVRGEVNAYLAREQSRAAALRAALASATSDSEIERETETVSSPRGGTGVGSQDDTDV